MLKISIYILLDPDGSSNSRNDEKCHCKLNNTNFHKINDTENKKKTFLGEKNKKINENKI